MIDGERTQMLQAVVPPEKYRAKKRNTLVGLVLVAVGTALMLVDMWLVAKLTFDKWLFVPLGVGLLLTVMGGHIASGELMSAAIRDIAAALKGVMKRDGGGA